MVTASDQTKGASASDDENFGAVSQGKKVTISIFKNWIKKKLLLIIFLREI